MELSFKQKQVICLVYCCVLFASGVFLICTATVVTYKMFIHSRFVPSNNVGPLAILLILGILNLFLTWIGVKGPTREHSFYIMAVVVFSVASTALLLSIIIWTFILYAQAHREVETIMMNSFAGFLESGYDTKDWTILEGRYKCCGVHGPDDYTVGNCTKSTTGCKELYVNDMRNLHVQIMAISTIVLLQSAIGCAWYYLFKKALHEERARRAKEKRDRLMRTRARRHRSR